MIGRDLKHLAISRAKQREKKWPKILEKRFFEKKAYVESNKNLDHRYSQAKIIKKSRSWSAGTSDTFLGKTPTLFFSRTPFLAKTPMFANENRSKIHEKSLIFSSKNHQKSSKIDQKLIKKSIKNWSKIDQKSSKIVKNRLFWKKTPKKRHTYFGPIDRAKQKIVKKGPKMVIFGIKNPIFSTPNSA